jgi:hypothetical protein
MCRQLFLIIFLIAFLFSFSSKGQQNISEKLVKQYESNSRWLTLRYDHYLKSGSFFYFENNNRFNQEPVLGKTFPFNSIYRLYLLGGYEHKASEKWYMGASGKYVVNPFENNFFTRANISHRGDFRKMKFIKEVAFEHISRPKSDNPHIIIQNEGRFSFSSSLVKEIKIKERPLFIILAYRAYMLFDFNNDDNSAYDTRLVDKTRLRLEVSYKFTDRMLVSLFAIRDTDYSYRQSSFDQFQNMIVEEARVNRITPVLGLGFNFVMNAPEDFLPGYPAK